MRSTTWTVVIPVKRLPEAKSRLREAFDPQARRALALAFVCDTVTAALACPQANDVLVVSDDATVRAVVARLGARAVPDAPAAGLNAAVRYGAEAVAGRGRHRAALAADLPALRSPELSAALRAAAAACGRCFVADATGAGTVLLTASPGVPLDPRFGPGSAAAHAASGAHALAGDWPGLRRDVDVPGDIRTAAALGTGPHTTTTLADLGLVVGTTPRFAHSATATTARSARSRGSVFAMQATVATFDPQARTGTLLLDDGSQLPFGAEAFDLSGLRLLRPGQRLHVDTDPAGQILRVRLSDLS